MCYSCSFMQLSNRPDRWQQHFNSIPVSLMWSWAVLAQPSMVVFLSAHQSYKEWLLGLKVSSVGVFHLCTWMGLVFLCVV